MIISITHKWMVALVATGLISASLACSAADVTLAWQYPATNTDGSSLTDLTGTELDAVRIIVSATLVSNRVQSLVFSPGATTTVFVAARTNAPAPGLQDSNTLSLAYGLYVFRARAVVAGEKESADSNAITNRVGTPGTVQLQVIK